MSVFQRQAHLTAGTVIDAENLPHVAVCRTAGVFLCQLRDGLGVGSCQLLHQPFPVVFALIDGDKPGHAPDHPDKVGIHIAPPRLVDDVQHLNIALPAVLLVEFVCCFDAVDLPGYPDAVVGKLHTGIYGGSHKVDRIRVSCHQIGTQTFARRQAGGNAGLQRKERCFVLLAQTKENLAADGQVLTAVAGPTCLHRVLPIKDVIAAIPKADLRIILLFADI